MGKISRTFTINNISKGISLLKKKGIKAVIKKAKSKFNSPNQVYGKWYAKNKPSDEELVRQREAKFDYEPLISILVPLYNTPEQFLKSMIESVQNQTYSNWELCLADGSAGAEIEKNGKENTAIETEKDGKENTVIETEKDGKVNTVIETEKEIDVDDTIKTEIEKIVKKYAVADTRIKYKKLEKNLGISGNSNAAAAMATGEYIGLLDHDDRLREDCLFKVVEALNERQYDVIYTDEDKITADDNNHSDPQFKPDFSIDFLRTHNYITHFFVVKKTLVDAKPLNDGGMMDGVRVKPLNDDGMMDGVRVKPLNDGGMMENVMFNSCYDGAQDYDFILRCVEKTDDIKHIPEILYHWRVSEVSTAGDPYSKDYASKAGLEALKAHIDRCNLNATVSETEMNNIYKVIYDTPGNPLVSIVIPNKDHISDLDKCIKSLLEINSYKNIEIIVVENNSVEKDTFDYYKELKNKHDNIKVINWSKQGNTGFNYSSINNYGVKYAMGEYILFLNNDTEIIEPEAISVMLGMCMREDVGAVGAKLLFEDNSVQHAGIVLGFGGFAGPVFTKLKDDDLGYMLRPNVDGNYSVVTAACMMTKKTIFDELEGFDEQFEVALNDVDFCMKIRRLGYLVCYCAGSKWHHYESKSRGYEDTPEKNKRFEREIKLFKERWQDEIEAGDPYYNKNLSLETPFMLDV